MPFFIFPLQVETGAVGAGSHVGRPDVDVGDSRARTNVVDLTQDDDTQYPVLVHAGSASFAPGREPDLPAGAVGRHLEAGIVGFPSGAGGAGVNIQPVGDEAAHCLLASAAASNAGVTSSCSETVVGKRPREQEPEDDDSRDQVCVCAWLPFGARCVLPLARGG